MTKMTQMTDMTVVAKNINLKLQWLQGMRKRSSTC